VVDGGTKMQHISESSCDWCSVVSILLWSKYVDNIVTVTLKRTELCARIGESNENNVRRRTTGEEGLRESRDQEQCSWIGYRRRRTAILVTKK